MRYVYLIILAQNFLIKRLSTTSIYNYNTPLISFKYQNV